MECLTDSQAKNIFFQTIKKDTLARKSIFKSQFANFFNIQEKLEKLESDNDRRTDVGRVSREKKAKGER